MLVPNVDSRRRTKVKTACRTCKIRKVKCGEERPACQRCLSTGRKCDGYGVWDRPVGSKLQEPAPFLVPDERRLQSKHCFSTLPSCSPKEQQYLEWFMKRTTVKLPGTFLSSFWSTLLLQATTSEHAVFHAVIALGCVHKEGSFPIDNHEHGKLSTREEYFTLQHYLESIKHLRTHFKSSDRGCVRVVLISCITFVCLDFLRGHFQTAESHLRSGLQVLNRVYSRPGKESSRHSIIDNTDDRWISEIFSRLNFMTNLFGCSLNLEDSKTYLTREIHDVMPSAFHSLKHAWQELEYLLSKALALRAQARSKVVAEHSASTISLSELSKYQQSMSAALELWLQAYQDFVDGKTLGTSEEAQKAYHMLYGYHLMATIMARTAMRENGEIAFDSHTELFLSLIEQMYRLRFGSPHPYDTLDAPVSPDNLHDFISDVGWIPPLYYTALHCRNHRIRLLAVQLLRSSCHREGLWDSRVMSCVARKVVALEEQDFYRDLDVADDFELTSRPDAKDLLLPILPESQRLSDIEIVLSGAPMDEVQLYCHRLQQGRYCKVLLSKFCVHSQRWQDCS